MTEQELREQGGALAVLGGAVGAVRAVFGGRSRGRAARRARVAAGAARALKLARTGALRRGRTFGYELGPEAVYQTQPTPAPPAFPGAFTPGDWVTFLLWAYDTATQNQNANAAAQQAVTDSAPWWAVPDVVGPPGPYESGQFFGVNAPLIRGSRQDPRGIRRPVFRLTHRRNPWVYSTA